jgi:HlyD family secretion protein
VVLMILACDQPEAAPTYQVVAITERDIVVTASAAGSVEPIQTVEVKSKASGEITEVAVEVGDNVERGDLLVRVDQRIPRNAVVQAEADLEVARAELSNAESQLNRSQQLFETQAITEQEFETARLAHASARARLVRAERTLEDARIAFEDTEVRAASSGTILSRQVEVGTVIQSASSGVGGGAILLTMANLETVQVRTLVDETDIGKISAGLPTAIRVDAYPNQPFQGEVLKIEPQSLVEQNVTMFPVLIRIPNVGARLRPGMNAEVEISIGRREGVPAVPNSALRTRSDVGSAAQVLGLPVETVQAQLASASNEMPGNGAATPELTFRGEPVTVPQGATLEDVRALIAKVEGGGREVFQSLSAEERTLLRQLRENAGVGGGAASRPQGGPGFSFGGDYVVFAMRNGTPTAIPIRTGLTDLDYSEVLDGLVPGDTVLVLPSAGLIQEQQERAERAQQRNQLPISRQ